MEADSDLASLLLQSLKVEKPCLPPKTWESIPSESGGPRVVPPPGVASSAADPIYEPSVFSEAALVRMVMNALQGNKVALDDIEKVSSSFCSTPADRTVHRVPRLWQRSSSTNALGKILKAFSQSGHLFLFLRKFVDYFCMMGANQRNSDKNTGNGTEMATESVKSNSAQGLGEFPLKVEDNLPPHTLVNQAFAVAVRTVLEGYICAVNTLSASVKLRRSTNANDKPALNSWGQGNLRSIIDSDVTLIEVYLHTKELRIRIEALGNICSLGCGKDLFISVSCEKDSVASNYFGFDYFPRGADLLTYLYVQLRDSDPVHRGLLKFLFARSCEPYCGFIRSWIYKAKVDDPHKEFIIEVPDTSPSFDGSIGYTDGIGLASIKECEGISLPFFLEDVRLPLVRAGQQLQVLLKLLDLCNCSFTEDQSKGGASMTCNLASFENVLPCWNDCFNDSCTCLPCLTFCGEDITKIVTERETMYGVFLDRLKIFFADLNTRNQRIKSLVNSSGLETTLDRRSHGNSRTTFVLIEGLDFSGYIFDKEAIDMASGYKSTDISSTSDDSFNEIDDPQLSEFSSLGTSEEEREPVEVTPPDMVYASCSSNSYTKGNGCQRMHQIEKSLLVEKIREEVDQMKPRDQIKDENINLVSVCLQGGQKGSNRTSEVLREDCYTLRCWPLGGLLKNPFHTEAKHIGQNQLSFTGSIGIGSDGDVESLERDKSYAGETFLLHKAEPKSSTGQISLESGNLGTLSTAGIHQPWISKSHYDLNRNPMLGEAARLRATCNTMDANFMPNGKSLSYFDFSLVVDPQKIFLERLTTFKNYGNEDLGTITEDSGVCVAEVDECVRDRDTVDPDDQSDLYSTACLTNNLQEGMLERDFSGSVSGEANSEVSLRYSGKTATRSASSLTCSSEFSDIPLDFIIDKCILQEVILQYKYVSNFTIKLLDEGFALHEHLMALRRYYFMELADWADSFIMSLWNYKWYVTEPNRRVAEIQSFLEMALQRSSCESDPYRERLFIYTKGQSVLPLSAKTIGIFDLVLLGYRVDWPINIVASPDALNIYADIFSFLMQVRLALFSLSDMWHPLKALVHSKGSGQSFSTTPMKEFNTLMKVRVQVNHFVSTLQQYVQSQLSDVSWSKFLYYLKHEVKDMLDLESVHMSYLADALHICFLSSEMQSIASIIRRILQCALDFQSCINGISWDMGSDGVLDPTSILGRINFSQVFAIKAAFEQSMKDLYICYLKSPKHCESGICRFWSHLNFNDYYSNIV